jgi:branched-chain amino acid transport system substrate-binding protein
MGLAQKSGANVQNDITATYVYDVWNNPNSATTKLYKSILSKYDAGADPLDANNVYGVANAATMVQALKMAGKNLTRQGLMTALTHLDWKNPFLYPGVAMKTTPTERFPIDQQILEQYKGSGWQPFGHIFSKAR